MVVNDTAGGLLLLSLATDHPALRRVGRLVLTNCESYDQFPPDKLRTASAVCRAFPRLARAAIRLSAGGAGRFLTSPRADWTSERAESFFGPVRRDRRIADDLVAAMAGFRPQLLVDAAGAIRRFDRPVLLIWGESCGFFRMADARRLASDFPHATLVSVPGARTWVPVDDPGAVADGIVTFVPTQVP